MDFSSITKENTEVQKIVNSSIRARNFTTAEVVQEIHSNCWLEMHYPDLISMIGTLTSQGITHDMLIECASAFEDYISESETISSKSIEGVIEEHRKAYTDQVGQGQNNVPEFFSDEVYKNLPVQLREICLLIEDRRKRDVFLMGCLSALSAAFSRYRFYHGTGHDTKEYSPHLLTLVLGAAGSGKGMTRYGNTLVAAISSKAVEKRKLCFDSYKMEKRRYEIELKRRMKSQDTEAEMLIEPSKPKKYCFAMSASDTTQAALVEILNENPIGGFAFDSELDTLTQGNARKDFGGFSDVLRKVFHHEPLARQRKGDGESYIVQQPRLALCLSGTHEQLKKLIQSEENGLFSRMWYYIIPAAAVDYKFSIEQRDIIGEHCQALQQDILTRADLWEENLLGDHLISLEFSESQEIELANALEDKASIEKKYGGSISASWLRMALIVKRIAVTLTALQGEDVKIIPANCWNAAISMAPVIKQHCLKALNIVRQKYGKADISQTDYERYKKSGMTDEQIAEVFKVTTRTLRRHKKEWGL